MKYFYTSENRLIKKHSYMYADFLGISFIREYVKDREERIKNLKHNLNIHCESDNLNTLKKRIKNFVCQEKTIEISNFKNKEIIEFDILLDSIAREIYYEEYIKVKKWIDLIVQRFEVSKKLFTFYGKNLKNGSGDYSLLLRYIKLSLLLTYLYKVENNIQHLSTVLKLNDLILSTIEFASLKIEEEENISFLIKLEVEEIKFLSKKNNLNL